MGVEGEEREKRKKEKQMQNHVTSHTTHTHLLFLPPSGVFFMIPDNLLIGFGHSCQCLCCCMPGVSGLAAHSDLENVFSKSISVRTRMMANCARDGQSEGNLRSRLQAKLTRKSFVTHRFGVERQTEPSHWFPPQFPPG